MPPPRSLDHRQKSKGGSSLLFRHLKSFSQPWGLHFRPCTHARTHSSVSVRSQSPRRPLSRGPYCSRSRPGSLSSLPRREAGLAWLPSLSPAHAHLNPEAQAGKQASKQAVPDARSRVG
ncbi:hypothetical protein LZ31DRAFT_551369 [Colletotrichum somersetense]|nr:hypothetical protein LZ31DRAFT_551369 [Colletotrichum somersetense]